MSGAGSPRYMAPEILSGRPYNIKADVYSFAIVLWEILSGQIPFGFVRERRHLVNFVVEENGRPEILDSFPDSIKSVLVSSFDGCITNRPEMVSVLECIKDVLKTNRHNSDMLSNSYLNRRRSFDSMRNLMSDLGGSQRSPRRPIPDTVFQNDKSVLSATSPHSRQRNRSIN